MFKMPIIPDTLYYTDEQGQDENILEDITNDIVLEIPFKDMGSTEKKVDSKNFNVSASRSKLQEAIIWTEILGKPMCKRRRKRYMS